MRICLISLIASPRRSKRSAALRSSRASAPRPPIACCSTRATTPPRIASISSARPRISASAVSVSSISGARHWRSTPAASAPIGATVSSMSMWGRCGTGRAADGTGAIAACFQEQAATHGSYVMNWDQIKGNWTQLVGKGKERWGKLTDNDWQVVAGKRDQLVGKLQERYGIAKEEAERQVADFERGYERV